MGLWLVSPVYATPGDVAAAVVLSTADGSIRTQAQVRMSLHPAPGVDAVMVMRPAMQARVGDLRSCFTDAMTGNARTEGRVVVQVSVTPRGKADARVTTNETGDAALARCMSKALSSADVRSIKLPNAAVLVVLDLANPRAHLPSGMNRKASAEKVEVRTLSGGRVLAEGGTHEGQVRFELTASAFARPELERVHQDLSARLAGLLDCRRKAARRGQKNDGSIELDLRVDESHAVRAHTVHSDLTDRTAPQCVSAWFTRSLSERASAQIALTVHFAQ